MRNRIAVLVVFITFLACKLTSGDAVDADALPFQRIPVDEDYMIVVDSGPTLKLSAQFRVRRDEKGEFLTRVVVVNDGQGSEERLSPSKSAEYLQLLRSFDWNAKPKKRDVSCVSIGMPRITFKARVDDFYREIKADGSLMPALANLFDLIVSTAKESNSKPATEQ